MPRTRPDALKVNDTVRRVVQGNRPDLFHETGVLWIVKEIEDKRYQDYWGYWYSWMTVEAVVSGRKNRLRTSDVVLMPESMQVGHRRVEGSKK